MPADRLSAPTQPRRAKARGFTLLEVLVALLVLALVMVALVRTAGLQAHALSHQRDSSLAMWVAATVAAELRLEGAPPVGRRQGEMQMGPERWRWTADTSETDAERLRRIEISVGRLGDSRLGGEDAAPVARLTAFASP
jgi:general secretion pathway protein I